MNWILSKIRDQFPRVVRTILPRREVDSDLRAFMDYVHNKKLLFGVDHPVIGFRHGPLGRFKLAITWPISKVDADKVQFFKEESILHGLWMLLKLLTPLEMQTYHELLVGNNEVFDELLKTHERFILRHWCCIHKPTSIEAANRFIKREWKKHGKPAGIPLIDYTYYALCLKCILPHNFGITVGVEMSLSEAGERIRSVLRNLQLFDVHIGADVLPEISGVVNPGGPFFIDEVRPHFEPYIVDGSLSFKVVEVTDPKFHGKKMSHMLHYKGSVNADKNRVMLPSRARD